jgi:CysZ protein
MNAIKCMVEGARLIRSAGLRRYVIMPLLISVVLLIAVMAYGVFQFDIWMTRLLAWMPESLAVLSWLIGILAAFIFCIALLYLFTVVANLVAAPFNALLSEKVELAQTGVLPAPISIGRLIIRAVMRELENLRYYLPRFLGLLVISLIPVVNVIAPPLWLLFGAWMMCIQYTDYAADNNQLEFAELRRRLGARPLQSLSFGVVVYLLVLIPVLNLVLIPLAVAGGTVFWVQHLRSGEA